MARITSASLFAQTYGGDDLPDEIFIPPSQKRKRKLREEDQFQIDCIRLIRAEKHLRFLVAQPDRIKNPTMWMRQFLKRLGIFGNLGHPEIVIFPPDPMRTTLIELKTRHGKMSTEQTEWAVWCIDRGYKHYVVRGINEMAAVLKRLQ